MTMQESRAELLLRLIAAGEELLAALDELGETLAANHFSAGVETLRSRAGASRRADGGGDEADPFRRQP